MTLIGQLRRWYSHHVEPHPSRFTPAYSRWAARADAHTARLIATDQLDPLMIGATP